MCVLLLCHEGFHSQMVSDMPRRQLLLILLFLIADRANSCSKELLDTETHHLRLHTAEVLSDGDPDSGLSALGELEWLKGASFSFDAALLLCERLTKQLGDTLRKANVDSKASHFNVRVAAGLLEGRWTKWTKKQIGSFKSLRVQPDTVLLSFLKPMKLADTDRQKISGALVDFAGLLSCSTGRIKQLQLSQAARNNLDMALAERSSRTGPEPPASSPRAPRLPPAGIGETSGLPID